MLRFTLGDIKYIFKQFNYLNDAQIDKNFSIIYY